MKRIHTFAILAIMLFCCDVHAQSDTLGKYPFLFYGDDFPELGATYGTDTCILHWTIPYSEIRGEEVWSITPDWYNGYATLIKNTDTLYIEGIAVGLTYPRAFTLGILDPVKKEPIITVPKIELANDYSVLSTLDLTQFIHLIVPGLSSPNPYREYYQKTFFPDSTIVTVTGDFYLACLPDQEWHIPTRTLHILEDHDPPYHFPKREIIRQNRSDREWVSDTSYRSIPLVFPIIVPRCEAVAEVRTEWDADGCLVATWDSLPRQDQWVVAFNTAGGSTILDTVDECRWRYCGLPTGTPFEIGVRSRCVNLRSYSWSPWHQPIDIGIREETCDMAITLSPNPARGTVQVALPAAAVGGRLSLCDLAGRELVTLSVTATTLTLDVGQRPAGVYLVKLVTPSGVSSRRLVVG